MSFNMTYFQSITTLPAFGSSWMNGLTFTGLNLNQSAMDALQDFRNGLVDNSKLPFQTMPSPFISQMIDAIIDPNAFDRAVNEFFGLNGSEEDFIKRCNQLKDYLEALIDADTYGENSPIWAEIKKAFSDEAIQKYKNMILKGLTAAVKAAICQAAHEALRYNLANQIGSSISSGGDAFLQLASATNTEYKRYQIANEYKRQNDILSQMQADPSSQTDMMKQIQMQSISNKLTDLKKAEQQLDYEVEPEYLTNPPDEAIPNFLEYSKNKLSDIGCLDAGVKEAILQLEKILVTLYTAITTAFTAKFWAEDFVTALLWYPAELILYIKYNYDQIVMQLKDFDTCKILSKLMLLYSQLGRMAQIVTKSWLTSRFTNLNALQIADLADNIAKAVPQTLQANITGAKSIYAIDNATYQLAWNILSRIK